MRKFLISVLACCSLCLGAIQHDETITARRRASASTWTITSQAGNTVLANTTTGATTGVTVLNGETIVFMAGNVGASGTITSITTVGGSCGSPFAQVVGQTFTGGYDSEVWAAANCPSSVTGVIGNWGSSTMQVFILMVSGMPTTVIPDGTNTASSATSTTTIVAPTVTTTKTGDLIVSVLDPLHQTSGQTTAGWSGPYADVVGGVNITSNASPAGTYGPTWTVTIGGAYAAVTAALATH